MRKLMRTPLAWLVAAEFIVVGVLIVVAWNVAGSLAQPVIASPPQAPDSTGDSASPLPELPVVSKPGIGPMPGLNLNSAFWRTRLDQLNREQVYFEQLEWHIVHSALDAAQRYVETVVIPAIQRAERP